MSTPQPRFFPHIFSLLSAVGFLCTGRRAVSQPPIRGNGPAADRANLKNPAWAPRSKGRPPAPDREAAPPPESSGTAPPSSISPAYSTHSLGAGSRTLGHSWHTILSSGARITRFSSRVSSRAKPSLPASRGPHKLPVAGHAADPAPVGTPGAAGALGGFAGA